MLQAFIQEAQNLPELNAENLGSVVKAVQKSTGLKGSQLWVPLRCAITREVQGPDLPLIVERPYSGGSEATAPRSGSRHLDSGTAPSSAAGAQGEGD